MWFMKIFTFCYNSDQLNSCCVAIITPGMLVQSMVGNKLFIPLTNSMTSVSQQLLKDYLFDDPDCTIDIFDIWMCLIILILNEIVFIQA